MRLWTIYIKTGGSILGYTKTIEASDLIHAQQQCLDEIKYCLKGKKGVYLESRDDEKYWIISDTEAIGEAEIQQIRKIRGGRINAILSWKQKGYHDSGLPSTENDDDEDILYT